MKNKEGFTLIELLTVIAILGILVLLAAPKFLGYTEKANIAKIQTGIKAVETAIDLKSLENPEFTEGLVAITPDKLQEINDSGKLIDKNGFIKEDLEGGKNVPLKDLDVKWNSGGEFILDKDEEKVYYYNKDINISKNPDGSATIPGDNNGNGNGGDDSENTEPPVTEPEITYPITHENGDKEDEDGTITKPDGTVIKPDGTTHYPNGDVEKDGTITKPNGDIVKPDGTVIKPDGTIIHPNGDVEKDGTITKPDGTIIEPDGTTHYPNGDIKDKDGNLWIKQPDGNLIKPDGSVMRPDGILVHLDGSVTMKDGTLVEMATDEDFSGTSDGSFKYTGTKRSIVLPKVIKGVTLTNTNSMFRDKHIERVVSLENNITNMSSMFYNTQATSLDLSSFNTSKVTNMNAMFRNARVTSLDLSSFDTSNVTDMQYMFTNSLATSINVSSFNTANVTNMYQTFSGSQATILDLSSFDISKVTNMSYMFDRSKATTGYARTQADADKFNADSTTMKPSTLTFTTK